MYQVVQRITAASAWLWRYKSLWLLIFGYDLIAGIYVWRRFEATYDLIFKAFYTTVCALGLWKFLKHFQGSSRWRNCWIGLFAIAVLGSVFTSRYPVRASSELDILLASFAMSYLFWTNPIASWEWKLRALGVGIFFFLHFSIGMCCACYYSDQWRSYPWATFFRDFCFSPAMVASLCKIPMNWVSTPLNYSNYQGYFGALTLPFFFGLLAAERRFLRKIVWILGAVYAGTIVFVSSGRMAWMVTGCTLFVWCAYVLCKNFYRKRWTTLILFMVVFFGIYRCCCSIPRVKISISTIKHRRNFHEARFVLAQDGWKIVQSKPWLGHGITTTPLHYLESQPEEVYHFWQLHVAPVQFLIEFGWVGGVAFFAILGTVFYGSCRLLRSASFSRQQKCLIFGCFTSFLAYLSTNSEDTFEAWALAGWVGWIIGFLWFLSDVRKRSQECLQQATILKYLVSAVAIVCGYGSICECKGRCAFDRFVQKTDAGDKSAEVDLQRALRADPKQIFYWNHGGYAKTREAFPYSKEGMQHALSYYETSLQINPHQVDILETCGALYATIGNILKAVRYYTQAVLCVPYHTFAYAQLLELLRIYGSTALYQEWVAQTAYAMPMVIFSQKGLLLMFQNHPELRRAVMELFQQTEHNHPELVESRSWNQKKNRWCDENFCGSWNYWMQNLNQGTLLYPFYQLDLRQYSTDALRWHGGAAPTFQIATLVPINHCLRSLSRQNSFFVPKSLEMEVEMQFHPGCKYARELLEPLIKKTLAAFE